jgi:ketosteroid isomerase-like protein
LNDAVDWIGGRFADGFVFRDGRIVEYRTFGERDDALDWAGIEDREPG